MTARPHLKSATKLEMDGFLTAVFIARQTCLTDKNSVDFSEHYSYHFPSRS
jgi:hypothetical protein